MSFTLHQLAALVHGTVPAFNGDGVAVRHLSLSSTTCSDGTLFLAIPGVHRDGHDFIDEAFARGAVAAVVSNPHALRGRPGIVVNDVRLAVSRLAAAVAGDPATKLSTIAITGTNGKTTVNWLAYHALNRLGHTALRIGTIGVRADGIIDRPGILTTPDAVTLHEILAQAVDSGVRSCVIEASSHALDQHRLDDLHPNVGVFTNLTRDHLDYHGTMERYLAAKLNLFRLVKGSGKSTQAAVINSDDSYATPAIECAQELGLPIITFGRESEADIRLLSFQQYDSPAHLVCEVYGRRYEIVTPLIGEHNASNLLATFGACTALGFEPHRVAEALSLLPGAPGRLEEVPAPGFRVFVDYAHTPDGLQNVLAGVRPITTNKLWVVFGCGGDRDTGKRPIMGAIASQLADRVVITSDNPRTEDPNAIIDAILSGGCSGAYVEPDRAKAIEWTLRAAEPGDIVIIAGKGHEDYQIIGTDRFFFSDVECAREVITTLLQ